MFQVYNEVIQIYIYICIYVYVCIHAAAAKSLQLCPTLWDPIDGSPPGFPIPGILQARTLERVAISFSNAWKWKVKMKSLSCVQLLATPWTAAHQVPRSMGFSRQECWSGVPLPSPRDLPYPGIKTVLQHWQVDSFPLSYPGSNEVFIRFDGSLTWHKLSGCFTGEMVLIES